MQARVAQPAPGSDPGAAQRSRVAKPRLRPPQAGEGAGRCAQSAQGVAEAVGRSMFALDAATRSLGMQVESIGPGRARLSMSVRPDMLNGHRMCHGGYITLLADSAFAFACNSYNELTVASAIAVDFLAPTYEGARLLADAIEVSRTGRSGVYDVTVTDQDGKKIAVMRGRSHTFKNRMTVAL